jgi:hypothetical protein
MLRVFGNLLGWVIAPIVVPAIAICKGIQLRGTDEQEEYTQEERQELKLKATKLLLSEISKYQEANPGNKHEELLNFMKDYVTKNVKPN